jgi:hypothetical protein
MKYQKTIFLSLVLIIISTIFSTTPDMAISKPKPLFFCGLDNGIPATMVRIQGYRDRAIIRWVSNWDSQFNITPQDRCKVVAKKFQEYYSRGTFKYIKSGIVNNQKVICVAPRKDADCAGVLWALRPNADPIDVLKRIFGILVHEQDPLNQSSGVFTDIEEILSSPEL